MNSMLGAGVVMWLIAIFIAILWILMPFAIFGTKPLLRQLLAEQKRTNKLLAEAADRAIGPTEVVLVGSRKRES
ncbi:MAG TPA: hypothetical protein VN280_06660 [Variovorax sp.]|nr:hypothetical protein [Variovorax sp.]